MERKNSLINIRGKLVDLTIPRVMGVINITPDSFFAGSRVNDPVEILKVARQMLKDGADFIDIGAYSSRPGAVDISPEEEARRIMGPLKLIIRELPEAILSVDTFRAAIAEEAVKYGAHIINDISGGEADSGMFDLVAKLNVPYILMHMQGTPATMQNNPVYEDVVADILKWMSVRIVKLRSAGVKDIIIDPGFGFGKTVAHNFEILRKLGDFSIAGLPVMAGLSRKSLVWKTLEIEPGDALNGTTVLNTIALMKGADILRVHDVKAAKEAIKLFRKLSE